MGFGFRKSRKLGPFRFTLTHLGLSGSAGVGPCVPVARRPAAARSRCTRQGTVMAQEPGLTRPASSERRPEWLATAG